jgi:2-iminobutanoate/2-iminopropanoate deaminase
MIKDPINPPGAAPPVGPYSPGLVAGNLLFISGQVGVDADGKVVGDTAAEQARAALDNLHALLSAAAVTPHAVVKTTIFLTDIADFAAVNEAYAAFFTKPYPARSTVQVAALPLGVKVEIEAVALTE